MSNLDFSEPIILSYNQTMSVVVDGLEEKKDKSKDNNNNNNNNNNETENNEESQPKIGNYGLIVSGEVEIPAENETSLPIKMHTYNLKAYTTDLDENRNFKAAFSGHGSTEAKDRLTQKCGSKFPNKIGFTVKTFPHFGAYGYINYNLGDESSFQLGLELNTSRDIGDIFSETE